MLKKIIIISILLLGSVSFALAITNIDTQYNFRAWNDSLGWIEFVSTDHSSNEVVVGPTKISGSGKIAANGNYFSLDCATSPNGNICVDPSYGASNYFVSNDGSGNLAGYAWADSIGWVSLCGNASVASTYANGTWTCPASPIYQVTIRDCDLNLNNFEDVSCGGDDLTTPAKSDRFLSGYAWNDSVGWVSFNCTNYSGCAGNGSYNRVTTYWGAPGTPSSGSLISATYDTCPSGAGSCSSGVAYNYILWKGVLNGASNSVKFKLATSNCKNGADPAQGQVCDNSNTPATIYWGNASGDGAFLGSAGSSGTYYGPSNPDQPVAINSIYHNNKRYYRYQIFLVKTASNPLSPVVQDVVVNWSF